MKKRKMVDLNSNKNSKEISEVYALLDVMKEIKIKESQWRKKKLQIKRD